MDQQDFSRIENWGKVAASKNYEEPLVSDFVYIKPVAKSFDEKFLESLRKFAVQIDAMIADIKDQIK